MEDYTAALAADHKWLPPVLDENTTISHLHGQIEHLEELFHAKTAQLQKLPLHQNTPLWLASLVTLVSHLKDYKEAFSRLLDDEDRLVAVVGGRLAKLCGDYGRLVHHWTQHDWTTSDLVPAFVDVVTSTLDILLIDGTESFVDSARATLKPVGEVLARVYTAPKLEYFPALARFVLVTYQAGECRLIELMHHAIDPSVPIEVARKHNVLFTDLIDYYRYTAFIYTTLAFEGDTINAEYAAVADTHYRILLRFPNLDWGLYVHRLSETPSHVSLKGRQELSLLFVLNHLSMLDDILDLVHGEPLFAHEISFLRMSLRSCISSELDKSASSLSLSISRLAERELTKKSHVTRVKLRSLSTILYHGTYMENLVLILNFFELFRRDQLLVELSRALDDGGELLHVISNIDGALFPGKVAYVQCMYKLVNLFKSLALKCVAVDGGINNMQRSVLSGAFGVDDLDAVLSVKPVLSYTETEGVIRLDEIPHQSASEHRLILQAVKTHQLTKHMDEVSVLLN